MSDRHKLLRFILAQDDQGLPHPLALREIIDPDPGQPFWFLQTGTGLPVLVLAPGRAIVVPTGQRLTFDPRDVPARQTHEALVRLASSQPH